jgi:hypothetical protein
MNSTAAPDAETGVLDGLREVNRIYAALADTPAAALSDARLRAEADAAARALRSAQEMLARIAAAAEGSGAVGRDGAVSARAWLTARGVPPRDAARAVAHGSAMAPAAEPVRLAWARGQVCGERAEAIAAAVNDLPETADPRAVEAAQQALVEDAKSLTVRQTRQAAGRLVDAVDPAGADKVRAEKLAAQEQNAYDTATLVVRKGTDGTARFSGTMPNLTADMLIANLDAICDPRRDHRRDASPADEEDGSERAERVPYAVRIGRAFCELVESFRPSQLPRDRANAVLVVTVDEQDLRRRVVAAGLPAGGDVSAGDLRRVACGAGILPAVLDGASQPLDLGHQRRLFSRAQRTALTVRDRGCVFPGCGRPPGWTEAHHVQHWADGGPTDLNNAALLCGRHHRLVHRTENDGDQAWEIHIAADGRPEITPPKRIDPHRRPLRNQPLNGPPRQPQDRPRRDRRRERPRPEAA